MVVGMNFGFWVLGFWVDKIKTRQQLRHYILHENYSQKFEHNFVQFNSHSLDHSNKTETKEINPINVQLLFKLGLLKEEINVITSYSVFSILTVHSGKKIPINLHMFKFLYLIT